MMAPEPQPQVIQWAVDTHPLWPSARQTADLSTIASRALALLPPQDQAHVLRHYHLRDAKVALASALLKRAAITRAGIVPWPLATATAASARDGARSKPVAPGLVFNVSHQHAVVVLLAVLRAPPGMDVGVDVVSTTERRARDRASIRADGWPEFVRVHAEVLCPAEVAALEALGTEAGAPDRALRFFYALWCLREAYVKMTGEALLAPWLGELEMRGFAPPEEMQGELQEVWLRGERVRGVEVRLSDLTLERGADGFMVSTAVRRGIGGRGVVLGEFQWISLDGVLAFAEGTATQTEIDAQLPLR